MRRNERREKEERGDRHEEDKEGCSEKYTYKNSVFFL